MFSKFSISFSAARLAALFACCFPGAFLSKNQGIVFRDGKKDCCSGSLA
jgi:hypothetical protein